MNFLLRAMTLLLFAGLLNQSILAQTNSTNTDSNINGTSQQAQLQSDEEVWAFFETLCVEHPTNRCQSNSMTKVHRGEIVPAPTYSENTAYHSWGEVRERALIEKSIKSGK